MKLSNKQQRFVAEYIKDMNGTQAAIRAGYSNKTAREQAARMLSKVNIAKEIESRLAKIAAKSELTAERVVNEVAGLAFANIADFVDVKNNTVTIKDWSKLTREQLAAVQEVQVLKEMTRINGATRKTKSQIIRLKLYDKRASLELLGRRFNSFPNKVTIEDDRELDEKLDRLIEQLGASQAATEQK